MWVEKQRAEALTTNKVFTDLSGLAICDYSLMFNGAIKFLSFFSPPPPSLGWNAGPLLQEGWHGALPLCWHGLKLNKHSHIKLDRVIITTCLEASKRPGEIHWREHSHLKAEDIASGFKGTTGKAFILEWSADFRDMFCGTIKVRIKASKALTNCQRFPAKAEPVSLAMLHRRVWGEARHCGVTSRVSSSPRYQNTELQSGISPPVA